MELSLEDLIERKPRYLKSLITFQQIINSYATCGEKAKMVNELSKSEKSFTDEFFMVDENELARVSGLKI